MKNVLPASHDASLAALLLAINPAALKGAVVRGSRGACEAWLAAYVAHGTTTTTRRVPGNVAEERLLGGLDFAATLAGGRAVCERGLLASAHDGCVVLSASVTQPSTWLHIARALDDAAITVERDGFSETHATVFAAIALETPDDPLPAPAFSDRVAFVIDVPDGFAPASVATADDIAAAQARLSEARCSDTMITALCRGALQLGVPSLRLVSRAVDVARTHAALHQARAVDNDDIIAAARLVFGPRATAVIQAPAEPAAAEPAPAADTPPDATDQGPPPPESSAPPPEPPPGTDSDGANDAATDALTEMMVRSVQSALPPGMLAAAAARRATAAGAAGRAADTKTTGNRGRQVGTRRGDPRGGARLDLVATLRAAVPWQRLRRTAAGAERKKLVEVRRDDFRVRRCKSPSTTTTLFVVDASGSSALNRLAEAKGAVELMLAEGYARRDRVALIAFRGTAAELVLPPTHALARARRAIAGMPAGGGTPIATALDLAADVVEGMRRDGGQTVVVILTDGQANVARDGRGGRARAHEEALASAGRLRSMPVRVVWIDTAARVTQLSRDLADALGARYVALPSASASGVRDIARVALGDASATAETAGLVRA